MSKRKSRYRLSSIMKEKKKNKNKISQWIDYIITSSSKVQETNPLNSKYRIRRQRKKKNECDELLLVRG